MSTMSLIAKAASARHVSFWNWTRCCFSEWRYRVRYRAELSQLDDVGLQDIGISRSTAKFEASKPFWIA
jgi:uncharacterized protein YjiS (DUF1127 family)